MSLRGQSEAYPLKHVRQRPRKLLVLTILLAIASLTILLHVSQVDQKYVAKGKDAIGKLQKEVHDARPFAHLHNPFKPQAHPPPIQKNSTWNEASWFADWKWLNPFSSTVTLDEDRALLPPLDIRPPIYTYYEPRTAKADAALRAAEDRLLEIWRRAWWAKGFSPVVLGSLEALENPMYQKFQAVKTSAAVEKELMRWLAWSHMGDGILANWLVIPMAEYYQPTLVSLRAARYAQLTRYVDLKLGLFTGSKKDVDNAINQFLNRQSKRERPYSSLMDVIEEVDDEHDLFHLEAKGKGVAFYSEAYILKTYRAIGDLLNINRPLAFDTLANLITGHLRSTFLSKYSNGIAVLSPYAVNATLVPHRALTLASALNVCPSFPVGVQQHGATPPRSCPPNNEKCKPCESIPILFPSSAPNTTNTFTLGTVPHTNTLARLLAPHSPSFNFTVSFIRHETRRDPFIEAATADITTRGISAYQQIIKFKENVAQPGKGAMRSIWRTAEADWDWTTIEWRLGFELPRPAETDVSGAKGSDVPQKVIGPVQVGENYPASLELLLNALPHKPSLEDVSEQHRIMERVLFDLGKARWGPDGEPDIRKVCDSWNLADAEAWRFVRALQAREDLERKKWLDEEGRFKH